MKDELFNLKMRPSRRLKNVFKKKATLRNDIDTIKCQ